MRQSARKREKIKKNGGLRSSDKGESAKRRER